MFVNSPDQEGQGQISGDSKWIVYTAQRSGTPELTVQPFPVGGTAGSRDGSRWVVAANAMNPRWSPNGKQLFYKTVTGDLIVVDVDQGPVWKPTEPKRLFGGLPPVAWSWNSKGDRILTPETASSAGPPPPFTLVLNWMSRLEP